MHGIREQVKGSEDAGVIVRGQPLFHSKVVLEFFQL